MRQSVYGVGPMGTPDVRRATPADAWELVRLRAVMLEAMGGTAVEPGPWQEASVKLIHERMSGPEPVMAAFVVSWPDRPGVLAACAVGAIDLRLGRPSNPSGRTGYVYNVCTEAGFRRRGYARACMLALLDWFRSCDVSRVDLRASVDGEALYRSLGFEPSSIMRMRL
jgi:ribosomal protein S18 acetylase RimI-like enzyme